MIVPASLDIHREAYVMEGYGEYWFFRRVDWSGYARHTEGTGGGRSYLFLSRLGLQFFEADPIFISAGAMASTEWEDDADGWSQSADKAGGYAQIKFLTPRDLQDELGFSPQIQLLISMGREFYRDNYRADRAWKPEAGNFFTLELLMSVY